MILLKLDKEDLKVVLRDLGSILLVIGYILLLPLVVAYAYGEEELYFAFLYPSVIAIWSGLILRRVYRGAMETMLKHAMLTAGLAWLVVSVFGAYPYIYVGMDFLNSYFESMSGFTTTGMTMIDDIAAMPKSLLFWRAMTQWVGGVGVIMLFLVVLVQSRMVIARFYMAEARTDRIKPAISTTVSFIWRIYLFFTLLGVALYFIAGMGTFDSVTPAFTSLSTGGFSTHSASIAYFDSVWIEAVTVILMIMGGMSFVVHYRILTGDKMELFRNPEVKAYFTILAATSFFISLNLISRQEYSAVDAFRHGIFQVVAIMTTTGYTTQSIFSWPEFSKIILLFLMVTGGCIGSTGGGFKVFRMVVLLKHGFQEMMKNLLPGEAVITLKIGDKPIESEDVFRISGLFFLFLTSLFGGGLIFSLLGYDAVGAMSLSFSALSNVGPVFLPEGGWFALSDTAKAVLIVEMWAGRLEIFPALALIISLISLGARRREAPGAQG
jgi:trk system potassium uptake protein TrkH